MSDDISVPRSVPGAGPNPVSHAYTHSYRARRSGPDAGTRRLVIAASALGLLLLGGMGVWTFSGHQTSGVPTIQADTRPLRVKPENPGGMTVVGANDQVGRGDGTGTGDLAPEAERPDPQALRAQRQAAATPATPPAAAPVVARAAAPEPARSATPSAASGAASGAATAAATTTAPASGGVAVQIAAVDSEALAMPEWQRLARKAPELLGERKPSVSRIERDGKTFWRVRTGGFSDMAAAAEFCRKVRAKGLGCSIPS